jgi:DNA-binding NarL/FixJ family response regulator
MRIAIIDESSARASIIEDGLSELDDCEIHTITSRQGLLARIAEISPDIVFMDLGNPARNLCQCGSRRAFKRSRSPTLLKSQTTNIRPNQKLWNEYGIRC